MASAQKFPKIQTQRPNIKQKRSYSTNDAQNTKKTFSTPSISPRKNPLTNRSSLGKSSLGGNSLRVQIVDYEKGNQQGFTQLEEQIQNIINKNNYQRPKKEFEKENEQMLQILQQMNTLLTKKLDKKSYFQDSKRSMGFSNTNQNRNYDVDIIQNNNIIKANEYQLKILDKRQMKYKNFNSLQILEDMYEWEGKIKQVKSEISKLKSQINVQNQTKSYQNLGSASHIQNAIDQQVLKQKKLNEKLEKVQENQKVKKEEIAGLEEQLAELEPKYHQKGQKDDKEIEKLQQMLQKLTGENSFMTEKIQKKNNQELKEMQRLRNELNQIGKEYNNLKGKIIEDRKSKKETRKKLKEMMKETNKNKSEFLKEFKGDQYNEEEDKEQNRQIKKLLEDNDECDLSEMSLFESDDGGEEEQEEEQEQEQEQYQKQPVQNLKQQQQQQEEQEQEEEEEEEEGEEEEEEEEYEDDDYEEDEDQEQEQNQQEENSDLDLDY